MHQTHPDIRKRLLRAKGHLDHIIEMLAEGRPCTELAQQLQAVEKAVGNAKKNLIHDHLDHCIDETSGERRSARSKKLSDEFRSITKYL